MDKALKIGGGVVLAAIALFAVVSFFSNSLVGTNTASMPGVVSKGVLDRGVGLSDSISAGSARSEMMSVSPEASFDGTDQPQDLASADKKMIKNGSLNLKVDNADAAAGKISEIAKGNGGEVSASNFYQSGANVKSGTVTVKVPVANFEKTFAQIKKVASLVIRESTSGQDVTEQYVDLQAQLKNRQAEEQSFVKILGQAHKIDDVLAVTRELARVRGNIEQLQGRIKYLDSQTDMSTISVNLTEDANITLADSWRPFQVVKESFNALVRGLQGFVDFLIRLLIVVVPILILLVAVLAIFIWIIYRLVKKIYLKIKTGNEQK